jgi:hypothetical protein
MTRDTLRAVVTSGRDDAIVAPGTPDLPRTGQLGEIVRDELIASKTSSGCLLRLRSGAAPLRGIDGRRLRPSRRGERHIPVDALVHERLALLRPHGAATGKPAHSLPAEVRGPRSVRTGDASRRGGGRSGVLHRPSARPWAGRHQAARQPRSARPRPRRIPRLSGRGAPTCSGEAASTLRPTRAARVMRHALTAGHHGGRPLSRKGTGWPSSPTRCLA